MEVKVIHVTHDIYGSLSDENIIENAKALAGREAGICYMADNYFSEKIKDNEAAIRRANMIIKSGHHSPFDHFNIGLEITGIPKIIAMTLNSVEMYTTSEKSARYTFMHANSDIEQSIYEFWTDKFKEIINSKYPSIEGKDLEKLAIENSRYMLSVFTPTSMGFTASFRQLSYMRGWLEDLYNKLGENKTEFNTKLMTYIAELRAKLHEIVGDELKDNKNRGFKFFYKQLNDAEYSGKQYIGDVYSIDYYCSLACLAHLIRHRTIDYMMDFDGTEDFQCYIPPIIRDDGDMVELWKTDFNSVKKFFPQCTLVHTIEQGITTRFIDKCAERLCGRAQIEIAKSSEYWIKKFIENKDNMSEYTKKYLDKHTKFVNGVQMPCTKCSMEGIKCTEACRWGAQNGLTRLI